MTKHYEEWKKEAESLDLNINHSYSNPDIDTLWTKDFAHWVGEYDFGTGEGFIDDEDIAK